MRRLLDKEPGVSRGQEELKSPLWKARIDELVSILKKEPMTAAEACKHMQKKRRWPAIYTTNTIAAADIAGLIDANLEDNKWRTII
jgi:hypothetical protein